MAEKIKNFIPLELNRMRKRKFRRVGTSKVLKVKKVNINHLEEHNMLSMNKELLKMKLEAYKNKNVERFMTNINPK